MDTKLHLEQAFSWPIFPLTAKQNTRYRCYSKEAKQLRWLYISISNWCSSITTHSVPPSSLSSPAFIFSSPHPSSGLVVSLFFSFSVSISPHYSEANVQWCAMPFLCVLSNCAGFNWIWSRLDMPHCCFFCHLSSSLSFFLFLFIYWAPFSPFLLLYKPFLYLPHCY